jgi:hypothetical protein
VSYTTQGGSRPDRTDGTVLRRIWQRRRRPRGTSILPTPQDQPQISDEEFVKLLETAVAKLGG